MELMLMFTPRLAQPGRYIERKCKHTVQQDVSGHLWAEVEFDLWWKIARKWSGVACYETKTF